MVAVIAQCEMTVDKLHVVKQMNEQEAKNYAKLHQGNKYPRPALLQQIYLLYTNLILKYW